MPPPDAAAALSSMAEVLAADGYRLEVSQADGAPVRLQVVAGPDACEECLVPKEVFESIALDHLARAGLHSAVEIRYPSEG